MQLPESLPPPTGLLEWLKWLAIVSPLILTAYVLVRQNTSRLWKEERDAALAKADRLKGENEELKAAKGSLERELEECRHKTDLTHVLKQQAESHAMMLAAIERTNAMLSLHDRHMGEVTQVVKLLLEKVERI